MGNEDLWPLRMRLENKFCHDSKVASASTTAPIQVGMGVLVGSHDFSRGKNDCNLRRNEQRDSGAGGRTHLDNIVDDKTMLAREPAKSASEGQATHLRSEMVKSACVPRDTYPPTPVSLYVPPTVPSPCLIPSLSTADVRSQRQTEAGSITSCLTSLPGRATSDIEQFLLRIAFDTGEILSQVDIQAGSG